MQRMSAKKEKLFRFFQIPISSSRWSTTSPSTPTTFAGLFKSSKRKKNWVENCPSKFRSSDSSNLFCSSRNKIKSVTEPFTGCRSQNFAASAGVNVIKLFSFIADDEAKQARVFVPDNHFPV